MEGFSLFSEKAEKLKDIQTVLGLPELKIVAPSDTRWLAHERCINFCYFFGWGGKGGENHNLGGGGISPPEPPWINP